MKIEMHIHTRYSKDSMLSLNLLYIICRIKKVSCIAITDHNTIKGAVKFKEKFHDKGIKVIIGEEIMTTEGEIAGLFLKNEIKRNMSPDDTINEIIRQGGLVYIPHPYDKKRNKTVLRLESIERNREKITFIECHNGRNISEDYSLKQNEIAERLNLTKVIGSDAHTMIELGRNYMIVPEFNDRDTFINAVKNAVFNKKKCIGFSHYITKAVKLVKLLIRGDFYGLFRIINKRLRR